MLAIKDMSSLLKPLAAHKLITALKQEIGIPVHLHTHDTSGNGGATLMMAAMAGVDIVDAAFGSMAGLTSQPSLNSLVAALENSDRDTGLPLKGLDEISSYWEAVRPVYKQFESDLKTGLRRFITMRCLADSTPTSNLRWKASDLDIVSRK